MKVSLTVIGAVGGDAPQAMNVEPAFYTGNKKSAVGFIKAMNKDGEVTDEVMLQVSDTGQLSIARRRAV